MKNFAFRMLFLNIKTHTHISAHNNANMLIKLMKKVPFLLSADSWNFTEISPTDIIEV